MNKPAEEREQGVSQSAATMGSDEQKEGGGDVQEETGGNQ